MEINNSKWIKIILLSMTLYIFVFIYVQSDSRLPWYEIKKFIGLTQVMNTTCNGTVFPTFLNNESSWGPVDKEKSMFVISAYYVKSRNRVFIIGAKPFHSVSVICQIWWMSSDNTLLSNSMQQTKAEIVAPTGGTYQIYASTIFACKMNSTESPTHVSLVLNSCDNPLNMLQIRDVSKPENYERRFTMCMSPLFRFGDSLRLVEWIEFNRILGAEKFVLYNYSTSAKVDTVINHYFKAGLIEVIQWRLPFPEPNIEFFAQKAALNDCLFRNKNVSEFIINADTDEFIIPHGKEVVNWSQMLAHLDQNCAGYLIRHTFFRTDWKNEDINVTAITKTLSLLTLTYFEHEDRIYSPNDRSKYFARTEFVEFANVHEIPRGRILTVSSEKGLVHHYRKFTDRKVYRRVKDFTVLHKFGDNLIKNVQATLINLI